VHPLSVQRQRCALAAADAIGLHRAALPPALHSLTTKLMLTSNLVAAARRDIPASTTHHPFTQIHRIRSCHPWLASSIQQAV
jgi:hypothetical protein